jgi:hypothetical protein
MQRWAEKDGDIEKSPKVGEVASAHWNWHLRSPCCT